MKGGETQRQSRGDGRCAKRPVDRSKAAPGGHERGKIRVPGAEAEDHEAEERQNRTPCPDEPGWRADAVERDDRRQTGGEGRRSEYRRSINAAGAGLRGHGAAG